MERKGVKEKKKEIEEELLKKRILLLTEEITREKAIGLREKLLFLNAKSDKEKITLIVDSPGGNVIAAFIIYESLSFSRAPVTCIINGECSSSGVIILQGAKKRVATKHSFFYLHPIAISFEREPIIIDEKAEEKFKEKLRGAKERQRFIYEILMKKTGRSLEEIKEKEEKIMFAEKAKEFGLIDKVIEEYKI